MMNVLTIIKDFFRSEVESFVTTTKRFRRLSREALAVGGRKAIDGTLRGTRTLYGALTNTQRNKQISAVVATFLILITFLLWQFLAYDLPQTIFVAVNIFFFAAQMLYICISKLRTYSTMLDLNQTIDDIAQGRRKKEHEVEQLKAEIKDLQMQIDNRTAMGKNSQLLLEAIRKNKKQQRPGDLPGQYILRSFVQCYQICGGVIYMHNVESGKLELAGQYAIGADGVKPSISEEDGLVGQAITDGKAMSYTNVSVDYLTVVSGLGEAQAANLYVLPIRKQEHTVVIIEVTSFSRLSVAGIWKEIEQLILAEI